MQSRKPAIFPRAVVALVVAAGLFVAALSGGSYDVVDRQTAAVVIWWAVGLGAVVFAPPRRPAAPGVLATACAAGIAVWIAVNVGSSVSHERTVVELGRAVTHLGPLVLIGWVLPKVWWRGVFAGLMLAAVAISVASFGVRLSPGFLGQTGSTVFNATNDRLASPFGYWNAVGSWSVLTAMMLLAVSAHHRAALVRSASLAFVPMVSVVGYLTYSRATIGALFVGLVVLLLASKNRWTLAAHGLVAATGSAVAISVTRGAPAIADATGVDGGGRLLAVVIICGLVAAGAAAATGAFGVDQRAMPRRPAAMTFGVTVVIAVIVGAILVNSYGQKAWDQFNTPTMDESGDPTQRLTTLNGTRSTQWKIALKSYRAHKAHGTGAGTFEITNNLNNPSAEFVRDAHNAYLEALSEQGWPGFALLLGLSVSMIAAVVLAARRVTTALDRGLVAAAGAGLAAFTAGTIVDWFWEVTALALLAMALLGVVVAAGSPEADDSARRERPLLRRLVPRAAVVVVAIIAIMIELPVLVGTSDVRRSQQEVRAGNLTAARARADQAIDIMYWASSPYLQRALVDEQAGDWASARRSIRLAVQRDPQDWRLPLVQARIDAKAGRPKSALAAYRQAKRLRPYGAFFR